MAAVRKLHSVLALYSLFMTRREAHWLILGYANGDAGRDAALILALRVAVWCDANGDELGFSCSYVSRVAA